MGVVEGNEVVKKVCMGGCLLITLILIIVYMIGFPKIQIKDLQSVTVELEETAPIKTTNQADLSAISRIFHQTFFDDNPSCPFGDSKIVLQMKNKTIALYPALDGCYVFKDENSQKYIEFKKTEYGELMHILKKHGFEKSDFQSEDGA